MGDSSHQQRPIMIMTVKKTIFAFFLVCFFTSLFVPQGARAEQPETVAKQLIIVDYDTGDVLMEKNADERMPTSSMSKIMTLYMVFDALKKGAISLDDEFLVSEKAWRMQGSKMFVPLGKKVRVEDLIRGVGIQSGNDATIVLAEGLAGSEDAFVAAMNKKAQELGMTHSHFMNASGWPDPDHYSTARDLAILARHIMDDFPEYYHYFSEKEFTYNKIKQGNRNPLLYRNIGVDGIKTGHTEDGGYGLMGSGKQDGRRVIMVINGLHSMQERADESARLIQWAMTSFKNVTLFKKPEEMVLGKAGVVFGNALDVPLVASKPVTVTLPVLYNDNLKVEINYKTPLVAPIKKGTPVGTVNITLPQGKTIKEDLVAGADVGEVNYFIKLIMKARMLSSGGRIN